MGIELEYIFYFLKDGIEMAKRHNEKMLIITNHERNANPNHEVSPQHPLGWLLLRPN